MSTKLYPSPVYGPVNSRRLGVSLGINLMPSDGKICTFDCIYCECGYNKERRTQKHHPTRKIVYNGLEAKLQEMKKKGVLPDVITFAGNGEPTSHPAFPKVIDDVIQLRNEYCPDAKISVLSNATFIKHKSIHDALMKVDNNILKIDTVDAQYIDMVNRPVQPSYNIKKIIEYLKTFNGHVIIQTMFMKGEMDGKSVDNTGDKYVKPWLDALKEIKPQAVMIYTIDRETPDKDLLKASKETLDGICEQVRQLGFLCSASY